MLTVTGGLVLLAALLHATWNAMLHGNADKMLSMSWMAIAIALVSTVAAALLPWPPAAAWPCIVASGLVHNAYNLSLVRAYRTDDLVQSYPIARGSSPLLVTLGAALFAHEAIGVFQVAGIALITGGILALALIGHRVSRAGALAATGTGALIALYTVIDGVGVRASGGQVLAYIAWMFVFYWGMPALLVARRGVSALTGSVRTMPAAVASSMLGGLVSIAAYGIVIWAMRSDAMGAVSALRETSVVFAALIGQAFLREHVTRVQWLACVLVACGAVCLGVTGCQVLPRNF